MNEIADINILKNVNFKELKELNLSYNKISDIKILEKVKFEKLEILDLRWNEIADMAFMFFIILFIFFNYMNQKNILYYHVFVYKNK